MPILCENNTLNLNMLVLECSICDTQSILLFFYLLYMRLWEIFRVTVKVKLFCPFVKQ